MDSDKQNVSDPSEPETPPDPDIIDLPRRAIGTPQVLAGFLFLLALVMMEGVIPALYVVDGAQRSKRGRDGYYSDLEALNAREREMMREELLDLEEALREDPNNLSEEEREQYKKWAESWKGMISGTEETFQWELKAREKYYKEVAPELLWQIRYGYISMICFALGAMGLIFGAIGLAVSIGTGRRWTWVNVILLPVTLGAAFYFLYLAYYRNDEHIFTFVVVVISAIPLAIVLRRMVEWIAPVRDESHEGRDRLRRSHLSRACVAALVLTLTSHVFVWLVIAEELGIDVPYSIRWVGSTLIPSLPISFILIASVLLILKRARVTAFTILVLLLLTDIAGFTYYFMEMIYPYWDEAPNNWILLLAVTPLLLFFYPVVAVTVMLVRPLGRKLFERPACL